MPILLIAGMPGSGKEEFLGEAVSAGIPFIRMGDVVREYYGRSGSAVNGIPVGRFADNERRDLGNRIWAERALERMSGDLFLVDGCRSMNEVCAYRELGKDVRIIAIHSSPDTRYARLVKRARDDAPRNTDEFDARDARELSWGLGEVMARADIMLVNASSLDDFRELSRRTLEGLCR